MSLLRLGKNTAIYAIGNICLKAAAFLLIPLYTHSLSLADYGLLATLLITIQSMLIVMNLGMRTSLMRFTQEYTDNGQIGVLLGTTMLVNILGGVCVITVAVLFLLPFFRAVLHTNEVSVLVILACIAALAQSMSLHIMSYYRALHRAVRFMAVGFSSAILLIITSYIALRVCSLGIIGALGAYILTHMIITGYLSLDVLIRNHVRISLPTIPRLFRFGFPLVLSMAGGTILVESGIYFLSYYHKLETVAIYSLGFKLSQLLAIAFILPFQLAFQPFMFSSPKSAHLGVQLSVLFKSYIFSITIMSFLIILGAHIILPYIAPPEYAQSFDVLLYLLPLTVSIGIHYFSETLLSAVNKTHIIGITMGVCAIICLFLNYMLIPSLNLHGAAFVSNVCFFSAAFIVLLIGVRAFSVYLEWSSLSVILALFVAFLFLAFLLNRVGNLAFYAGWFAMFSSSAVLLYRGPFFNKQERVLIKSSAARLRSAIIS